VKHVQFPYVDRLLDDDVSCIQPICNRICESLNRQPAYEENINYGENDVQAVNLVEKVELPSKKQFVQQLFVPTTTPMEEQPPHPPPQVQVITITSEVEDKI
jgi:hypothetical protein